MAEKDVAPCIHRFVQARSLPSGKWRVYCRDCGKWMRNIKASGPDLNETTAGTVLMSFSSHTE